MWGRRADGDGDQSLSQAEQKVAAKGWKNVHVVEADACTFTPPGETATLVTFSYSLSSAPHLALQGPVRVLVTAIPINRGLYTLLAILKPSVLYWRCW